MSALLDVDVIGTPIPQGSVRAFARRGGGHPIVTADNVRTRPWRDVVAWNAHAHLAQGVPTGQPVIVALEFRLPRPAGHFGRHGLLPSAPPWPGRKPDLDKLTRAVLDALTEAGVWRDDAQVTELRASKRYTLDQAPGAHIVVWPVAA